MSDDFDNACKQSLLMEKPTQFFNAATDNIRLFNRPLGDCKGTEETDEVTSMNQLTLSITNKSNATFVEALFTLVKDCVQLKT